MLFKELLDISGSGVYCLEDNINKEVYITYTVDMLTSLARVIRDINSKTHTCKRLMEISGNLDFRVLENINKEDRKSDIATKLQFHITEYINKGYVVINKHNIIKSKIRIDIHPLMNFIHVKLVNSGGSEQIVGIFENMEDAKEFAQIYDNMDYITPVYSTNQLTRSYIKAKK